MLILIRYYDRKRLPRIVSFNTPLICLQRFLLPKVLLHLVTTLQDYLHFKAGLKIENII